jgi:hypothetical protein
LPACSPGGYAIPICFWGLVEPVSWSLFLGVAIILTLVLKYVLPRKERCPDCQELKDPDHPLCRSCGWIFDVPGDD